MSATLRDGEPRSNWRYRQSTATTRSERVGRDDRLADSHVGLCPPLAAAFLSEPLTVAGTAGACLVVSGVIVLTVAS
jgi:hypothetical protein